MTNREEIERRRTFAIISHPDAGKTTLTEKLLLYGGAINQAGSVKGKQSAKHAVSDWMDIEKQRGISVTSSVLQFNYAGKCVNILDTPGHQDFSEDTYRTLMAADSAVMVIDAAKGVEAQTIKLFKVCTLRHIPIFTFINKMDREARDPFELMENIEEILGIKTYPMNWPIGCGSISALHEAVAVADDSGHCHAAQEAQLGLAVLGDRVTGQVTCLLFLEGDAVAVCGDGIRADIALGHVNSDELDIRVLISSPSQRSTVQVADADDHVCTVVDSLTDHGLTILIRSVSLGDVVLAVVAHVAGNSSPASLVEALIVDRAGVAGQSDLDDLLAALSSGGSSSGRSGAGGRSGRTATSGQSSGGGSGTSHSQEVTTRNLHKKVSFIFNPSRAGLQMQALAHLLVQV